MSASHSSLEHLKPQSQCCCLQLVTEFCHSAADSASWRRCFRKLPSFSWEVLVFTWMCSWCWLGSVPVLGSSGFIPQYHLGIRECNVVLATRRLPISLKNWKRTVPFPFDLLLSLTLQTSTRVFHLHTLSGQKGLKLA